jgi:chemotaxis protein MotB
MGRKKEKPGKAPSWITTMSDLNNLLLCFFILLYILTDVQVENIPRFFPSPFQGGLGPMSGGNSLEPGQLAEMGSRIESLPSSEKGQSLAKAVEKAVSLFQPEILAKKMKIQLEERGIVITLGSDFYFKPGSAELNQNGIEVLQKIYKAFELLPNKIRIEGHTDNTTIPFGSELSKQYPTNWDLSAKRAINVLLYLEFLGIPSKRLSAVAYGDTRPIETNETPEGRAYNRRVEIVIMREKD